MPFRFSPIAFARALVFTLVALAATLSGASVHAQRLSAGGYQTCVLTDRGGVQCWGGELASTGNYYTPKLAPTDVPGLTSGVRAIGSGQRHTCVLTDAGGVKCWGLNAAGELGDGTTTYRTMPVSVAGLTTGAKAVEAGNSATCALTSVGAVKCWGNNSRGRLGDGTTTDRSTPVDVVGLGSGVRAISSGESHTCAVTEAGGVQCWGNNVSGQLGDGTTTDRYEPVDVAGLTSGMVAVVAGLYHTCALTQEGGVKCWGYNVNGQLGTGTTTDSHTPVDVTGLTSGVASLTSGESHACVITTEGGVKCWGANRYGQLGDGTTTNSLLPIEVSSLGSPVNLVSAGSLHTCAALSGRSVMCWGWNGVGQIGNGTTTNISTPVAVSGGLVLPAEEAAGAPESAMRIYPSPARASVRIEGLVDAADVVDALGRVVAHVEPGEGLSVAGWSPGVYTVLAKVPQRFVVVR